MKQPIPGPNWECLGKDGDAWVICAKDAQGKRRTIAHVYQEPNARLIVKAREMGAFISEYLRRRNDRQFDNQWAQFDDQASALLTELIAGAIMGPNEGGSVSLDSPRVKPGRKLTKNL